jgi:quinoprotein dehydrogenase-associated probable ABC transporter substrate-binding protein
MLTAVSAAGLGPSRRASAQAPVHIEVPIEVGTVPPADARALRACSDPNNMPFSNERGEGFENRIAELLARDAGRRLEYYWMPQRRGFVRNTLRAGFCDLIMGVPSRFELALTTRPYYTSSYVFVSRRSQRLPLGSLDNPLLRRLTIGVQITGDDYTNPPAAEALAARGLAANVRGYTVYGDYSQRDPQRAIVDAVARGEIDAAIVWGPLAGYFARREPVAMAVTPVQPAVDRLSSRFVFDIAMAVRKDDRVLHDAVEEALERLRPDIQRILEDYGVPLVDAGAVAAAVPHGR